MPTAESLRIRRLRLKHYRSIAECDLELGRIAFFVGPNGSGKSNVVDSLRFLAQALRDNLDNALRQRGGVNEVRRRSNGHPRHFTVEVHGSVGLKSFTYRFTVGAASGKGYRVSEEYCRVEGGDVLSPTKEEFHVRSGNFEQNSTGVNVSLYEDRLALPILSGVSPLLRAIYDALSAMDVFSPSPEVMKSALTPDLGDRLIRDGSNIASVIHHMQTHDPETLASVEETLSKIVPGIQSVSRADAGSWETLEFKQDVAGARHGWTFPATSVSDGTLRALGVLTAIYALPLNGVYPPVVIEEPETALHPAAAGVLLEALREASGRRQILVTSHSPDLLDSTSIQVTEVFAVRSVSGTTKVNVLDQVGQEALRERLFTVGELLRVDQLQPDEGQMAGQEVLL